MQNETLDCLKQRRTVRSYQETPLTTEQIATLLEVALLSPSSMNRQPWHIAVVQDRVLIDEMEHATVAYYQEHGPEAVAKRNAQRENQIFYHAPAVFVISAIDEKAMIDVGILAQSLCIGAKSIGLDSVILGLPRVLFADPAWRKRLAVPPDYIFGIMVAVGTGNAPPRLREPDHHKVSYIQP